jgi:Domain of unknown function (DUF4920)
MYKIIFICFVAVSVLFSCNNQAVIPANKQFGEKITPSGAITYDAMLVKMGTADSLAAKVSGKVTSVCQVKGCWMVVQSDKPGAPEMTVKFKDYGFFMPKDLSGKRVAMEGYAFQEVTSVDELRHYAEDAHKSKEEIMKITEPKRELKFMAHGVVILD